MARVSGVRSRPGTAGIGVAGAATVAAGIATANQAKASSVWDTVAQSRDRPELAPTASRATAVASGSEPFWAAFGGTRTRRCRTSDP